MITMFDSIDVATVPNNPQAVAGYVGGNWPTYNPLVQKFPKAFHLSIAVNAGENAECLDCEPGDAGPPEVAAWVKRQLSRGVKRPVVYASVSSMRTIIDLLAAAGIKRQDVRLWSAHYGHEHICNPACGFGFNTTADGTQWTDVALGRNLDQSLLLDSFFIAPAPPDLMHYNWYPSTIMVTPWGTTSELVAVKAYDNARKANINKLLLRKLRRQLMLLALRVEEAAYSQPVNDYNPSWGLFNRGWRYQQLTHRAEGKRLI